MSERARDRRKKEGGNDGVSERVRDNKIEWEGERGEREVATTCIKILTLHTFVPIM